MINAPDTPGVVTNRATVDASSVDAFVNDNVTSVATTVTEPANNVIFMDDFE